jgi:hypothetical protein
MFTIHFSDFVQGQGLVIVADRHQGTEIHIAVVRGAVLHVETGGIVDSLTGLSSPQYYIY